MKTNAPLPIPEGLSSYSISIHSEPPFDGSAFILVTKNVVDSKGKLTGKTTTDRYPFKVKGKPLDYEDWIQGASLGLVGIPDVNEALDNTVDGYRTFRNHNNPKNIEMELKFSTADGIKEFNVGKGRKGNPAPTE